MIGNRKDLGCATTRPPRSNHACLSPVPPEESNPIIDHPSFETRTAVFFMGHVVSSIWKLSSSAHSLDITEIEQIDIRYPSSNHLSDLSSSSEFLPTPSSLLSLLFSLQRWLRNLQPALCISCTFIPTDDQSWTHRVAIPLL